MQNKDYFLKGNGMVIVEPNVLIQFLHQSLFYVTQAMPTISFRKILAELNALCKVEPIGVLTDHLDFFKR